MSRDRRRKSNFLDAETHPAPSDKLRTGLPRGEGNVGAPFLGVRASSPQRKKQAGKMPALPGEEEQARRMRARGWPSIPLRWRASPLLRGIEGD